MEQDMLSPEAFDTAEPLPQFEIAVQNLRLGGVDLGPARIPVSYDQNWQPRLQLGEFATIEQVIEYDDTTSIRFPGDSADTQLLISRREYSSTEPSVTIEAIFQITPCIANFSGKGDRFQAVVLSPPDFLKKDIVLQNAQSSSFVLSPFSTKSSNGCLLTSDLKLDASDPFLPLRNLITFLTFVKGGRCGVGNLIALAYDGSIAFQLIGFSGNDQGKRQTNWFDFEIQADLSNIFACFTLAAQDDKTSLALIQTINYYRASNASREVSIEMAIIAAHTALEALVNYILESRAGWSRNLMSERNISFHDKMRAAAANLGLEGNPLDMSPELVKLSRSRNNEDAYSLISLFRNKLVHQDAKLISTGRQLHEVWLLAQWMVEVFVFGVIGYRGKMIDRRLYTGWRGSTIPIPLR